MKMEYIQDGSSDCPLIRIFGTEPQGFSQLVRLFRELSSDTVLHVAVHKLPDFETVGGCTLTVAVGQRDEGVRQLGSGQDFEWVLTPSRWETVADLTEPFSISKPRDSHIHQWLAGKEARFGLDDSEISVLISNSKDGRW